MSALSEGTVLNRQIHTVQSHGFIFRGKRGEGWVAVVKRLDRIWWNHFRESLLTGELILAGVLSFLFFCCRRRNALVVLPLSWSSPLDASAVRDSQACCYTQFGGSAFCHFNASARTAMKTSSLTRLPCRNRH